MRRPLVMLAAVVFVILGISLRIPPSPPPDTGQGKQGRAAHEATMLERMKTVELPATCVTKHNDLFWIVKRYDNYSSMWVLIEWSDNQHREHFDIQALAHQVQMVAGKQERDMVQNILEEWWMRRTLQTNPNMPQP